MKIPFTKAHGAKNDFLLTWSHDAPDGRPRRDRARHLRPPHRRRRRRLDARRRRRGMPRPKATIQLYNSDGSIAEISGNGTRCAAAFLIRHGHGAGVVRVRTGAGVKTLRLLERGRPRLRIRNEHGARRRSRPAASICRFRRARATSRCCWVGNPQCAVPVDRLRFRLARHGRGNRTHPHFPNRTNVSFVQPVDEHTIDVRFYERGAGETMSSGTGSTGAAAAALARGLVRHPCACSLPPVPSTSAWKETSTSPVPPRSSPKACFTYEKMRTR